MIRLLPLLAILAFVGMALPASAAVGDTTIRIFDRERIDAHHRVAVARAAVPPISKQYARVMISVKLECPRGGCDPWDRGGHLWLIDPAASVRPLDDYKYYFFTAEKYEIARFITPYGKETSYTFDISDYRSLMPDSVTLMAYITVYSPEYGYLMTVDVTFEEGTPDFEPYMVRNLWNGSPLYGNPEKPIEEFFKPIELGAEPDVEFVKARMIVTGHGQGNTDGAGEFARKWHELVAGGRTFGHYLWRDDCGRSAAGGQYGTWETSRAGFCPGEPVIPWDLDITAQASPGRPLTLDYNVEPYENRCRPGVVPCPCVKCEFDGKGHTQPIFHVGSQAIYYRMARGGGNGFPDGSFDVGSVGGGKITLKPNLRTPTDLDLQVIDVTGTEIFSQRRNRVSIAPMEIDLATSPGVYLLKIRADDGRIYRKRIDAR